jgi:D-3-phosphoglycerate dehydrogenase
VIEACPKLKLICLAFTGIDHVDQDACNARGIILHNAAGYAVHAVSELAIGLMIALCAGSFRRMRRSDLAPVTGIRLELNYSERR